MQWYLKVLKNYATFSGRARRKEFWMFNLINMLVAMTIYISAFATSEIAIVETTFKGSFVVIKSFSPLFYVYGLYILGTFLPGLAVTIRRLHDTNRSGWWFWISAIPLVGTIIILVFLVTQGSEGENDFGSDPLEEDND